uniref:Reverse transcriptase Ty1/copia-type domain-containing protein n=1 Tax=Fagus sylvatica TaxID=28930 RepID=A0A2N9H5U2_FAGSY
MTNPWLSNLLYFHACSNLLSLLGSVPDQPTDCNSPSLGLNPLVPTASPLPSILGLPPSHITYTSPSPNIPISPNPSLSLPTSSPAPAAPNPVTSAPISLPPALPILVPPPLPDSLAPPLPHTSSHPMQTRSKSGISKKKSFHTTTTPYLQTEPPTYTVASKIPEWQQAMASEFEALQRQQTWSLVPSSSTQNVIGCRWVYKIKRHTDGSISRYKASLVAKGFHQQARVDYDETFSPVVKPPTVRIILSLAAHNHLVSSTIRCKLLVPGLNVLHPIYLLWVLLPLLLMPPCSYYVDVLLLSICYCMLMISLSRINYTKSGFFVHQRKYLTDLLTKFHMLDSKAAPTPVVLTPTLTPSDDGVLSDPTPYRSLVGALQYAIFTRPDITFAVNRVCQFMHKPTSTHFMAAKRILRFLKGTLDKGILFQPGPLTLTAFTDADWADDPSDRRSTSGITVFLGHNLITWVSKKQYTVSRSSTEAEYRSLAAGAAELAWLRQVL